MDKKFCNKCKKEKLRSEFNKCSSITDGLQHQCKECRAEIQREYRKTQKGKDRDSRYNSSKKHKDACYRYWAKRPLAQKANYSITNAVRDGRIIKPDNCESCGKKCNPEGHHDDYSEPMNVRWLCTKCHKQWHMNNKPKYPEKNDVSQSHPSK